MADNPPIASAENRTALLHRAREALRHAYAPYSHFGVAAAVLTADGAIYTGVNVENVSYGLTMCAERAAVFAAAAQGHRQIAAIAVTSSAGGNCSPCGACRQVLHEFATGDAELILEDANGLPAVFRLRDLLPMPFGPKDLPSL